MSSGLSELVDRFKQTGHAETADSWIDAGPNKPITPPQLQQAIGPDVLDDLSKRTGLSQQELLVRLSRELPNAVDKYTPQGRLPTEEFPRRASVPEWASNGILGYASTAAHYRHRGRCAYRNTGGQYEYFRVDHVEDIWRR